MPRKALAQSAAMCMSRCNDRLNVLGQFAALSLTSRSQHWHSPVPNLDLTRIGLANNVADTRLIETFEAIVALEDLHV